MDKFEAFRKVDAFFNGKEPSAAFFLGNEYIHPDMIDSFRYHDKGWMQSQDMLFYKINDDMIVAREKNFCFRHEKTILPPRLRSKTSYEYSTGNRNFSRYYIINKGTLVRNEEEVKGIMKKITGVNIPVIKLGDDKDDPEMITNAEVEGEDDYVYGEHPSEMKMSSQAHELKETILGMPKMVGLETVDEFLEKLPGILKTASKVAEKYEKEDKRQRKKYGYSVIPDAL